MIQDDPSLFWGCQLCGITLGEGIPDDFNPNPRYDRNFEQYSSEYEVLAPWFCIPECTDADRELSRKIFASRCGHVFCGRCVEHIGNRSSFGWEDTPDGFTIHNPFWTAPYRCPGSGCHTSFPRGTSFIEIFWSSDD